MDRSYGVNTSELRGETFDWARQQEIKANELSRKGFATYSKISEHLLEIITLSSNLKTNPLSPKNLEDNQTAVVLKTISSANISSQDKISLLMDLEVDMAKGRNHLFSTVNYNSTMEEKMDYIYTIQSILLKLQNDDSFKNSNSVKNLRSIVEVEIQVNVVKKYKEISSRLDTDTIKFLAKNGYLK